MILDRTLIEFTLSDVTNKLLTQIRQYEMTRREGEVCR